MVELTISVSGDVLNRLVNIAHKGVTAETMPETAQAFSDSARIVQRYWQNWIIGKGSLDGIENNKHPDPLLAQTIQIEDNSAFKKTIYSEHPKMLEIQNGKPEIDMKDENSPWLRSRKTRVIQNGKNRGKPYLIIPFRWNTSGTGKGHFQNVIPNNIYSIVKKYVKSEIEKGANEPDNQRKELNILGEYITRNVYRRWGDRYSSDNLDEKNMQGMVRMGKYGEPSSGYFTFRILSTREVMKNPESWIRKEVKPVDLEMAIVESSKKSVYSIIENAIQKDLS